MIFGAYYVLGRTATSWLGNKIVYQLIKDSDTNNDTIKENIAIECLVHWFLFIPTVALSCKLANLSAVPMPYDRAITFILTTTTLGYIVHAAITRVLPVVNDVFPTSFIWAAVRNSSTKTTISSFVQANGPFASD